MSLTSLVTYNVIYMRDIYICIHIHSSVQSGIFHLKLSRNFALSLMTVGDSGAALVAK